MLFFGFKSDNFNTILVIVEGALRPQKGWETLIQWGSEIRPSPDFDQKSGLDPVSSKYLWFWW